MVQAALSRTSSVGIEPLASESFIIRYEWTDYMNEYGIQFLDSIMFVKSPLSESDTLVAIKNMTL